MTPVHFGNHPTCAGHNPQLKKVPESTIMTALAGGLETAKLYPLPNRLNKLKSVLNGTCSEDVTLTSIKLR